jgi:hypothetical protein
MPSFSRIFPNMPIVISSLLGGRVGGPPSLQIRGREPRVHDVRRSLATSKVIAVWVSRLPGILRMGA